jgi:hypothetical protein
MTSRLGSVLRILVFCAGSLASATAGASEVRVVSRTIGEGYSIRVPGPEAALLSRRRLVQYINLGVYDMLPPKRADELHRAAEDGQLRLITSMRLRHDFGSFVRRASGRAESLLDTVDGRQIDLLYGYLEGERLGGWVDLRAGRQFESSGLDWYVFDGAWVRVRTPAHLGVEAFSGLNVDGTAMFGYPTYELDGTAQTPADDARSTMFGAALSVVDLKWVDARVAYRRTMSPALLNQDIVNDDGTVGLASGVDQELVSATAGLRLLEGRLNPFGALRYNLGTSRVDDATAGIAWTFTDRHTVRGQWIRTIPAFDLDSIFNVFSSTSFEDFRVIYQVRTGPRWTLSARGQTRVFGNETTEELGTEPDRAHEVGYGGGLQALHQRRRFSLRIDGFGLGGEGGVRAGGSVGTRTHVAWDRLALDGRAYGVYYADEQVEAREGYSFALQAGANLRLYRGVHLNVVGEEMFTSFLKHAFRVLAVFNVDWSFRAGRR